MNKKCQVFTPHDYVEKLLDCLEYKHHLYGKKIMENSCGDGNILAIIVQRYIDDCRMHNFSRTRIRNGLSKDICGVEIDPEQFHRCIERLNLIVEKNNILPVKWNISNEDYLKKQDKTKYNFIVGNPPYITYSELKKEDQNYLKNNFDSCKKGKFDYCYAFLEKSIATLTTNGKMAYLIPSSVFKTVFGKDIRRIMLPFVKKILDYTQEKLFQKALVKSSIIVLNKNIGGKHIHYIDSTTDTNRRFIRESLGNKWTFINSNVGQRRFGNYFKVSHVVATLYNRAFVLKEWIKNEDGNYVCGDYVLESEIVRRAVSPKNMYTKKHEIIIFPYKYDNKHQLIRYKETEFANKFPGAYKYLKQFRENLDKRDSDKAALWYEYGRSQALNNLDCEKALISTIISNEVLIYKLEKECIPYAGMYITPIGNLLTITDGIEILKQDSFFKYVRTMGIPINGNSVRITSKDIEDYMF